MEADRKDEQVKSDMGRVRTIELKKKKKKMMGWGQKLSQQNQLTK